MHRLLGQFIAIALCIASFILSAQASIFDYAVQDANGASVQLSKYRDAKAIIIVNVASNCGYTYTNYRELIGLYNKYASLGLEILAFPSNQFGEQEPAPNAEIQTFCSNYGVTFPVLAKVDVNGPAAIDLFKYLKEETGNSEIGWNFNKFLVVDGRPVKRYASSVKPSSMEEEIKGFLGLTTDL